MTQAQYDAGEYLTVSGGFIEIIDSGGTPTGVMYITGPYGAVPVQIDNVLFSIRKAHQYTERFRVLYDIDGVEADLADPTDINKCLTIIGITEVATALGDDATIISRGEIPLYSGLSVGPMYLGASGTITQVVPTTGVLVELGYVANTSMMVINVERPIVLA
jgi:hypothetical protein